MKGKHVFLFFIFGGGDCHSVRKIDYSGYDSSHNDEPSLQKKEIGTVLCTSCLQSALLYPFIQILPTSL